MIVKSQNFYTYCERNRYKDSRKTFFYYIEKFIIPTAPDFAPQ